MAQIEKVLHNVSWETRGNQRYYYRGSRQQGRVVKEYVGRGAEAEAAAERDLAGRAERAARRQAEQQRRQEYESITEGAWGMATEVDATLAPTLAAAGYHRQSRGPWRRRRVTRES